MKRRLWKHNSNGTTVEEFTKEKTGKTLEEIEKFTGKSFKRFPEVKKALEEAKKEDRLVVVVGDYDSDGINSTNILATLLKTLGMKFQLIIPKRESEGYGLSDKIIERIPDNSMLITVDNGITAVKQMEEARRRGIYTIILDHHTAGEVLPEVDILIDPSAIGEADYTHYCGGGISYRLAEYILGEDHPVMKNLSVNAAIATIGDVVELSGDNRKLVKDGMQAMLDGFGTESIKALLANARFSADSTANDLAFNIVPVLNAPERLEDGGAAKVCGAIIKNKNFDEGVEWLLKTNKKRKDLVASCVSTLDFDELRKSPESVIFVKNREIPLGIAGIIAGQLSEKTGKPSFVFGYDKEGNVKGSARNNVPGVSIIELIRKHEDLLLGCGGHPGAAGLSLEEKNYAEFFNSLSKDFEERIAFLKETGEFTEFDPEECTKWDIVASDLNIDVVAKKVLALEPTGEGNPAPKVKISSRLVKAIPFGGEKDAPLESKPHIRFNFAGFNAIGFNMNAWYEEQKKLVNNPRVVELVGTIGTNTYQGNKTIQIRMDDFEIS